MKRLLKIMGVVAIIVALGLVVGFYLTSGQREVARNFLLNVSSGAYEDAQTDMHSELIRELPIEKLKEAFGNAKAYAEVNFKSLAASGGRTTLEGIAITADGCASTVKFTLLNDQIISFNIAPLCLKS